MYDSHGKRKREWKEAVKYVDVEILRSRGRGMRGTKQGHEITEGSTPVDDKAKGRGRGRDGVQPWRGVIWRLDVAATGARTLNSSLFKIRLLARYSFLHNSCIFLMDVAEERSQM